MTPRIAKLITDILAPWVVIIGVCLIVAAHATTTIGGTLLWGGAVALFTAVIPMAIVTWGVRRGRISDVHVRHRGQRLKPLAGIITSASLGLVVLHVAAAPDAVIVLAWVLALGVLTTGGITVFWKISFHTGVSAGAAVVIGILFGWAWTIAAAVVVAVVGWSRIVLRDHTVAQACGGALWGATVALAVLTVAGLQSRRQ